MKRFAGKTVFITGAMKRLGFEMARAFANEGANIVCHYFSSQDAVAERLGELEKIGVRAWAVRADLTDRGEVEALFPKVLAMTGSVDILVHNASMYPSDGLSNADISTVEESMWVHAWAPLVLSRAFEKSAKDGACIVSILDASLQKFQPKFFSYQLGKLMLKHLTEMMAMEFAPKIRVNGVSLGPYLPDTYHDLEKITQALPIPRLGRMSELLSSLFHVVENGYITGEIIHVDGGLHIKHGQLSI